MTLPPPLSGPAPPPAPAPAAGRPPGLSGCALAAIVGGIAIVLGIALVAMLAAIAMPAYQDYVGRSKLAVAVSQARALQPRVDAHVDAHGGCPDNAALGLAADEAFPLDAGFDARADVRLDAAGDGACRIQLTFSGLDARDEGATLDFLRTGAGWDCTGGSLAAGRRPPSCRAPGTTP